MSTPFWRRLRKKALRAAPLDDDPLASAVRNACRAAGDAGKIAVKQIRFNPDRELDGFCSVLAEVHYDLGGGRAAGLRLIQLTPRGNSHWWVTDEANERVVDLIADAGERIVPYEEGRSQGLMNGRLSRRTRLVRRRVHGAEGR